jgi:3-hydroxyisobutyrate dehydrogenase
VNENVSHLAPATPQSIAFLGLGVMGYPMAGHLAQAGHDVTVFNRTHEKAISWVARYGGRQALSPAEAARGADVVFACVGNDNDLADVVLGDNGALSTMAIGSVFVDHTTASAQIARQLHAHAREKGVGFVDAPVSGGQIGAERGQLTVMCGGEDRDFMKSSPLIGAYAKSCVLLGPPGSGQLTKMVNQICIAGLVQALAEGIGFAQAAGLDADKVVDVISKGAAQSWQMENRAGTMAKGEFDFGFAVELMRKDLGICIDESRRNGAQIPVTALVDQFYARVELMGGKRWDTSSLVSLVSQRG